jgi:hypothetical protein
MKSWCVLFEYLRCDMSFSMVKWLSCLPLDSRFACSNPAEDDGFSRVIISVARLPKDRKQSRRQHVVRLSSTLKNPAEYDRDTSPAKLTAISRQIYPCYDSRCLLLVFSRAICLINQEWLELKRRRAVHWKIPQCMGRFVGYHPVTSGVRH